MSTRVAQRGTNKRTDRSPSYKSESERFWLRVDKTDSCWNWTAGIGADGHGRFYAGPQRHVQAHRYSFELHGGVIPEGLVIDHLCRNPRCVNPGHLEPVTVQTNTLRGIGVSARSAVATHCPMGHAYDAENTYVTPKGHRDCRICRRAAGARARARKKVAANA
jgi:hypothetical protein